MRARSLFIVLLFCLTAIPAAADSLTIVDVLAGNEVQQTNNNPCIFGDASCDPGLLGTYTEFPTGGGSQTYEESQSYTIETIRTAAGNVFDIGVDVNTTNAATDTLDYFRVYNATTNTLLFSFETDTNLALAVDLKNGTGWSDWLLQTVDLTGVAPLSEIRFDVRVTSAVDGREQFFIIPNDDNHVTEVPEPASLLLVASGVTLFASRVRNRRKRA
jgi:hypothetical protein